MIKNMRLDQKTHKEEISAAYTWFFKLPKLRRKESTKPGVEKVVADSLSKYRPSENDDITSMLEIKCFSFYRFFSCHRKNEKKYSVRFFSLNFIAVSLALFSTL